MSRIAIAATLLIALSGSQRSSGPTPDLPGQDIRRLVVLAAEDGRAPASEDLRALLQGARSENPEIQAAAIRALGRLERRDVINDILRFLRVASPAARAEAANALAQALRGEPLADAPEGQQEQTVADALLHAGAAEMEAKDRRPLAAISRSLGRLPYQRLEQFEAAEAFLRRALEHALGAKDYDAQIAAARGLESLARLNRRLGRIEEETLTRLRTVAVTIGDTEEVRASRRNAMAALVAAQGVDGDTIRAALDDLDPEVRRLAVVALSGAGSPVPADQGVDLIRRFLGDRSFMVRYEAVRAWTRHGAPDYGCLPLVDALGDENVHVVLAAMDALADQCRDDESITDRLASESRTPPPQGRWHREAHAYVALAKRDARRAAVGLPAFAMHQVPWVRMYAARAAAAMNDVVWLTRLAGDPDDNVAEAALPPLRKRVGADSDSLFAAALRRKPRNTSGTRKAQPYELIRTAAIELKGARPTPELLNALVGALLRISLDRCETSRDVRLALLDRLSELGGAEHAQALTPLLKDIDPRVANSAAALINRWTGRGPDVQPERVPLRLPTESELSRTYVASVRMESGRTFRIALDSVQAPLATTRFVRLALANYYDGLTIHRVVPNFVVQGGSPDANEYCGDCPFMRDEVGLAMHDRGSVGISTRGRDTGDAQFFINMVDNPRLDHDYTVFGHVDKRDMEQVVDAILEGDRIVRIRIAG